MKRNRSITINASLRNASHEWKGKNRSKYPTLAENHYIWDLGPIKLDGFCKRLRSEIVRELGRI